MIRVIPDFPMKDRNGQTLKHGDYVLAKIWLSYQFTPCQVVGFTNEYVVLIPNGSSHSCMRKSYNLVKVKDYQKWKINL